MYTDVGDKVIDDDITLTLNLALQDSDDCTGENVRILHRDCATDVSDEVIDDDIILTPDSTD